MPSVCPDNQSILRQHAGWKWEPCVFPCSVTASRTVSSSCLRVCSWITNISPNCKIDIPVRRQRSPKIGWWLLLSGNHVHIRMWGKKLAVEAVENQNAFITSAPQNYEPNQCEWKIFLRLIAARPVSLFRILKSLDSFSVLTGSLMCLLFILLPSSSVTLINAHLLMSHATLDEPCIC